jgi:hypothetical protein
MDNTTINNLKKLNYELPDNYNSITFYNDLLEDLLKAVEASKDILKNYSATDSYSRFKERLNKIIEASERMDSSFDEYSLDFKRDLVETINDEFEYINGMLESYFVKMGKLYEFWRYDYNKTDIYRASRHQLVISPVDGSLLPIVDRMRLTD